MKKLFVLSTTALIAFTAPAMANGNSDAAKNMADTLSSTPGIGAAAPSVSGKNAIDGIKSDSGWGNAGSRVVSGQQVSRGKK
ncbi:hypothetical protein [Ruegeria conchae]|uniref:Uncharacterized protein n=1 Tax=Ruegeria conchae TaxID=981384 RepID=A0A497Z711_9RHOB|nr:hypothetical protein [Ruegeria conchae]RLK03492.1 hypothetical protein CLV75_2863 [Ruegeria conchae]